MRAALLATALLAASPTLPAAAAETPAASEVPARVSLAQLRKQFGKPGDKYVTLKGVELRYRDEGNRKGPVLLLLHGSRSTLNQWDGVTARLKDRYRIVRFDMPPTGLSGPLTDEAKKAVGGPSQLVALFLDAVKVDKAVVAGVSSGGTMGYYFAAEYPDRVSALYLTNTPSNPVPELKVEVPPALEAATKRAKATGVEGMDFWSNYMGSLYGDPARMPAGLPRYYYETNLRVTEANPRGLHALTANKADTMARLAKVKAPVLIGWGMRDYVLRPQEGRDLASYLTNAKSVSFVALDTVGHYPPMESPEAVADLLDAWLKRDR